MSLEVTQAPMAATPVPAHGADLVTPVVRHRFRGNPWRRPVFLEGFTWLYLAWSLIPIAIAVVFSFNNGKSVSTWQGFSTRWYWGSHSESVFQNPIFRGAIQQTVKLGISVTILTLIIGVAFGIGIHRWRSKTSIGFNFVMVFSYVVPELIFATALFFVFTQLFTGISLGTAAEILGLITWNISWPAIIVMARLNAIGPSYEEAAADLGCTRFQAIRRVLLPMLMPAIFASAVLIFATTIDDFVIVDLLSSNAATQPISVLIYSSTHGGQSGPQLNALATIMLVMSLVAATVGLLGYRWITRGERGANREDALTTIAGM